LRARSLFDKAAVAVAVEKEVLPHLASGRLRVPVQATVAMDRAEQAYEAFAAGGKFGTIILVPPGSPGS
jgi:NADPH:quinone reductase-like Zn-dependent oxidoreductase